MVIVLLITSLLVPTGAASADPASDEHAFVASINRLRADKGLTPLKVDAELTSIARRWAGRMADANAISHNAGFSGQVTSNWRKLGENVGRGPNVADLMQAFIDSPTHYANLVDAEFAHVGVGVVERNGELWTAHQFMILFDEPAASAPVPAAPAPAAAAPAKLAVAPVPRLAPSPAPVAQPVSVEASAIPSVLASLRLLDA